MTWGSRHGARVLTHPHVASFCLVWVWCPVHRFFIVSIFSGTHPDMFSIPELRRKLLELRGTWKPFGIELMVICWSFVLLTWVFEFKQSMSEHFFLNSNNMLMDADPLSFSQFSGQTWVICWIKPTKQTACSMQLIAKLKSKPNKQSIKQTNNQSINQSNKQTILWSYKIADVYI